MVFCDGKTGVHCYGVFRGRMRGRSFDSGTAERLAVYTLQSGERPDYAAMVAAHATPAAPAVYWQRSPAA
jgi:hypothetical protein